MIKGKYINKSKNFLLKRKGWFTLEELEKKYGKSRHTIRSWIKNKTLKAEKGKDIYYPHEYFVRLEDWLEVPTWKREYRKFKNLKK